MVLSDLFSFDEFSYKNNFWLLQISIDDETFRSITKVFVRMFDLSGILVVIPSILSVFTLTSFVDANHCINVLFRATIEALELFGLYLLFTISLVSLLNYLLLNGRRLCFSHCCDCIEIDLRQLTMCGFVWQTAKCILSAPQKKTWFIVFKMTVPDATTSPRLLLTRPNDKTNECIMRCRSLFSAHGTI